MENDFLGLSVAEIMKRQMRGVSKLTDVDESPCS